MARRRGLGRGNVQATSNIYVSFSPIHRGLLAIAFEAMEMVRDRILGEGRCSPQKLRPMCRWLQVCLYYLT